MASNKGPDLEELVRNYYDKQGYFALRSVPLRFENDEITDLDVWLYIKSTASARIKAIVDIKAKRSPKALERILWTKGLQHSLGCDRAFIVTTDNNPRVIKYANEQKISVLTKDFLTRLEGKVLVEDRLTLEAFSDMVKCYDAHKRDGDWLRIIADTKSALVSVAGFQAFNKAITSFKFFIERIYTRPQYKSIALRCSLLSACIACVSLDLALERVVFEDLESRKKAILNGVTYGDSSDQRIRRTIDSVLDLINESVEQGKVISRQVRESIDKRFSLIRADIIAEYFSRESHSGHLFNVAKELEKAAHSKELSTLESLSVEARSILGVFADFIGERRDFLTSAYAPLPPLNNTPPIARESLPETRLI